MNNDLRKDMGLENFRDTKQELLNSFYSPSSKGNYDIYPCFPIGSGKIEIGYMALARKLLGHKKVIIDGYVGVFWESFRTNLDRSLKKLGITASWINIQDAFLPEDKLQSMIEPYFFDGDPLFCKRFEGSLRDFFNQKSINSLNQNATSKMSIIYGCGAKLIGWNCILVYVDIPKNELQYRARASSITNLGMHSRDNAKQMYKRFYFIDWIVLNKHKAKLHPDIDIIVDAQHPNEPKVMEGDDLRKALHDISQSCFRVRPWFEPGPWGGTWIKNKIPQLPQDVSNYAWSFELIAPENGLLFESDKHLLEVSFDMLMFQEYRNVLGDCADQFIYDFPIRFDFLDTFNGGNLSIQCHPRPDYITKNFGEKFTQDETYYILDCKPGAKVYLGFQDTINPEEFRSVLESSVSGSVSVDINRFVKSVPSSKHSLFLIPHGTVHGSGKNNLVLEISATTYIYTFKMYDWLRLGLDGQPRVLNIERAFDNLNFSRKGNVVKNELISYPYIKEQGRNWRLIHYPTHAHHFYDVHRIDFEKSVESTTDGSFHIMMLVEGSSIILETAVGTRKRFSYAETFVVPAAAGRYRLINESEGEVKVIKAFMK